MSKHIKPNEESDWVETIIDTGQHLSGSKAEATFVYTGNKTIGRVKASCGCTSTKVSDNTIKATMEGRTKTKPRNMSKTIYVYFKGPHGEDDGVDYLTIKAEFLPK